MGVRAHSAVTFDAAFTGDTGGGSSNTLVVSNVDVATASDRYLSVCTCVRDPAITIASVARDAQSLTLRESLIYAGEHTCEFWDLVAPNTGAADLTITYAASATDIGSAVVTSFNGVHQTVPRGTFEESNTVSSSTTHSDTVSTVADDVVIDCLGVTDQREAAMVTGGGQTERGVHESPVGGGDVTVAVSTEPHNTGTATMSYSWGNFQWASIMLVALKPSAGGGADPNPAGKFVDGSLASDCLDDTYDIAARTCGAGSDGNAWTTITSGIAALSSGETLQIRAGTYDERIVDTIPAGTNIDQPTIVKAYESSDANNNYCDVWASVRSATGSDLTWERQTRCDVILSCPANTTNGEEMVLIYGADSGFIKLAGFEISGQKRTDTNYRVESSENGCGDGVLIQQAGNPVILQDMILENSRKNGLAVFPASGLDGTTSSTNNQFFDVALHHNAITKGTAGGSVGLHGIYIATTGNLIRHFESLYNYRYGLHVFHSLGGVGHNLAEYGWIHDENVSDGGLAVHMCQGNPRSCILANTIIEDNRGGARLGPAPVDVYGVYVYDNDKWGNEVGIYNASAGGTSTLTNSVIWGDHSPALLTISGGTTTQTTNLIDSDPDSVDEANNDFNITSGGAAENAGTDKTASCPSNDAGMVNCAFLDSGPNIGPFQEFQRDDIVASCEVGLVDASSVIIEIDAPLHGVGACTPGDFEVYGSTTAPTPNGLVPSACSINGNTLDLTIGTPLVGGDTITFDAAYGAVENNIRVGSLNEQSRAITGEGCTNNVGGSSTAVLTQDNFLFQETDDTEANGPAALNLDESDDITIAAGGGVLLRIKVKETIAAWGPFQPRLRVDKNGAASYAEIGTDCSAADVCLDLSIAPLLVANEATTEQLTAITSYVAGAVIANNAQSPSFTIGLNKDTEFVFPIRFAAGLTEGDDYDFRLYAGSTAITYAAGDTARVSIGPPVVALQ